jgi:hypothetical protein
MRLSREQQSLFWNLFQKACYVHNVPRCNQNDYRHGLIEAACGKRSLTTINTTDEFDAVLLALAREASDLEMIDKLLGSKIERSAYRVMQNVRTITGNPNLSVANLIAYCEGILTRKYGRACHLRVCHDWWLELTEDEMRFLVQSTSISAKRRRGKVRYRTSPK